VEAVRVRAGIIRGQQCRPNIVWTSIRNRYRAVIIDGRYGCWRGDDVGRKICRGVPRRRCGESRGGGCRDMILAAGDPKVRDHSQNESALHLDSQIHVTSNLGIERMAISSIGRVIYKAKL
jgi:hypothetical protein